jgi:hypothetical protein
MAENRGGIRASWGNTAHQQDNIPNVGDGGGGGGSMEPRVAKLEANMEYVKRDVGELRLDMRDVRDRVIKIEGDISQLPSKAFVFGVFGVVTTFLAAVTLFQTQIKSLLGLIVGF